LCDISVFDEINSHLKAGNSDASVLPMSKSKITPPWNSIVTKTFFFGKKNQKIVQ